MTRTSLRAGVERLRGIVKDCPLGWHAGRVVAHRGTSDADVVKWLQRIDEAAGTLTGLDDSDVPPPEERLADLVQTCRLVLPMLDAQGARTPAEMLRTALAALAREGHIPPERR